MSCQKGRVTILDVNWIKLTTGMFEDEKIDYIESLPEADTILMIWVRLLTIAGKSNVGGYIMLTEKIPYTEEMLAHKFKRQLNTVKFALRTFIELDMIGLDEFGLKLINWEKHQNVEGLEKIREQNRARKQKQRLAEKKQLSVGQKNSVPQCHVTVTSDVPSSHATELELEEELDIGTIIVPPLVETDIPNSDDQKEEHGKPPVKEKYKFSDEQMALAERLKNLMVENKPNMKTPSSLGQWANTIRLMIERDGREPEQIATVIDWCQKDKFWKLNILSADTLREKFDRLEMQMDENCKGATTNQAGNLGKLTGVVNGARKFIAKHGGVQHGNGRDDCQYDHVSSRQLQQNINGGGNGTSGGFVVANIFKGAE